jgi:hypothetical protein
MTGSTSNPNLEVSASCSACPETTLELQRREDFIRA